MIIIMAASSLCLSRTNLLLKSCPRIQLARNRSTQSGRSGSGGAGSFRNHAVVTHRYLQSSSNKNYNQAAARPLIDEDSHHQQQGDNESNQLGHHHQNENNQLQNHPHQLGHKSYKQLNNNSNQTKLQNQQPPKTSQSSQSNTTTTTLHHQQHSSSTIHSHHEDKTRTKRDSLDLSFNDTNNAFQSKTMSQLLRSYFILGLCSSDFLVKNNEQLMKLSRKLLGRRLFKKVMSATFYGQFVAGEDEYSIGPIIEHLSSFGVKSILDYSAEEDINEEEIVQDAISDCNKNRSEQQALRQAHGQLKKYQQSADFVDRRKFSPVARTYFYHGESQCEKNLESFFKSIDAVADTTKQTGLAAVKLTALGRPRLLMKLSKMIEFVKQLEISSDGASNFACNGGEQQEMVMVRPVVSMLDDILERFHQIDQHEIKALDADEVEMLGNMLRRVNRVAEYAREKRVRFMLDAEQTYLQPAINLIAMQLMRQYNNSEAIVFNTYQCYLKSAHQQVRHDLRLARQEGFFFGSKLVRGAYMEQERARAQKLGYPDPINPSYEETSRQYERTLEFLMREISKTDNRKESERKISIMVASHNEDTVRFTVNLMQELGIRPEHRVICFGQLYGMCDHVSFTLGQSGYSVYKYLPYGPVEEVLPYLARRATENHGIMEKVQRERSLLGRELLERFKQMKLFYQPVGQYRPV